MELSEFTLRIILLFMPGIISLFIIDKLVPHKEFKSYQLFSLSLLLGFICYLLYYPIVKLVTLTGIELKFKFIESLLNKTIPLDLTEIFIVAILSIFVGFIFTYSITYKILYRFAHFIKASNKMGEADVWSNLMNQPEIGWVVIRDVKNDLMYEGWVLAYSDSTDKNDEICLSDVKVYKNSTAQEMYNINVLYLPINKEDMRLEITKMEVN
ncbi:MAG: hypothetical protein HY811_01100 [Planctomycetes bacterium]|nr:hypothetical protein [Planctomycetota bacterium]